MLSVQKTTLIQGGSECIIYTTLSGSIGILVPFSSKEVSKLNISMLQLLLEGYLTTFYGCDISFTVLPVQ